MPGVLHSFSQTAYLHTLTFNTLSLLPFFGGVSGDVKFKRRTTVSASLDCDELLESTRLLVGFILGDRLGVSVAGRASLSARFFGAAFFGAVIEVHPTGVDGS